MNKDTKKQKPTDRTLKEAHSLNRVILESAGEGVYGVDLEGRTTFVNPAAEKLTGYSAKEMVGECQHKLTHHSKADGSEYSNR